MHQTEVSALNGNESILYVNKDHDYCQISQNIVNKSFSNNSVSTNALKEIMEVGNGENSWQIVSGKNKRSNSDIMYSNTKRSNSNSNPNSSVSENSSSLQISNSFDVLTNTNDIDEGVSEMAPRNEKPPPIFVPDIHNVRSMVDSIEQVISKDDYTYKCTNNNNVKINAVTVDAYRKLVNFLTGLKVQFHTFQIKKERAYRVVLKNMHFSNDLADIKSAIESYGHKVRNIANLKSSKTKNPLSIFFIDLEPAKNNKDIYQVEFLLNAKIYFEPPHKFKDIVQCKKCQRYGHTRSYCGYTGRCVKCGLSHDTSECKKLLNSPPKCALCEGEHPSNYKGCQVYKEIKTKSFPPLRSKNIAESLPSKAVINGPTEQSVLTSTDAVQDTNTRKSNGANMTYAQVTSQTNVDNSDNASLTQSLTTFFNKFEKLMEQQAQQIGTLLNLLTTVISKLK